MEDAEISSEAVASDLGVLESGGLDELHKLQAESVRGQDEEDKSSGFGTSDFESVSSGFSEISEIPEAIHEDSSSQSETSLDEGRSPERRQPYRGQVFVAWAASTPDACPEEPRASTLTAGPRAASPRSTRTPVRRARVRGTICLPTSALFSPPARSSPARSPDAASPRLQAGQSSPGLEYERARLELERELAAQRADASEEALQAERASYEAELARQAREAEDRQAVLQALSHDRTELAAMYREANQELCRLRAELSQRTVELLELRQEWGEWRRRQPSQNICVVCLDARSTMAVVPCGHLALCEACAGQLERLLCPVCRQPSESIMHIFMP